tara:strand:+ start:711 stop:1589 length:879 start_codon:yes stop_codon:yes gene_type:complete
MHKQLVTALKIAISAALIYFIFTKIDLEQVVATLQKTRSDFLLPAVLFFVVSKILSAFRLNLYFKQLEVYLTQMANLRLYLLGMFYNLFLPGGIGGDAYKGYLIKKHFEVKTKKVVAVLLLDRLSGLLLLFLYACGLALFLDHTALTPFKTYFVFTGILAVVIFWLLNKKFFPYTFPMFWQSFGYSAMVQLCQLASAWFVLTALSVEMDSTAYLFLFLISSIISVLPLTIGGIGSREITFFYGAKLLNLDENTAVGISMVFFLITAFVSLFGIIYHFKKPALKKGPYPLDPQ